MNTMELAVRLLPGQSLRDFTMQRVRIAVYCVEESSFVIEIRLTNGILVTKRTCFASSGARAYEIFQTEVNYFTANGFVVRDCGVGEIGVEFQWLPMIAVLEKSNVRV